MSRPVAVIAGANVGLGSAIAEALGARGYAVVALGRDAATRAVVAEVSATRALACDLTSADDVERAFSTIERDLGTASVVIYNAHIIELASSADTTLERFEEAWRVNCFGAVVVAKRALAPMRARGEGTLVFSGATGSLRGGKRSLAFSSSKFALRGVAQSLARELAPTGIHVVHVVLDGLVWSERSRARFQAVEAEAMAPHAIAATYLALIDQERSAWTHEIDLRPWRERF